MLFQVETYDFNQFWNLYDKKRGRDKAEKKWNRLSKKDQQLIFQTLPKYIESTPDKQYRKDPLTYLNGQSWLDEIIEEKTIQNIEEDRLERIKRPSGHLAFMDRMEEEKKLKDFTDAVNWFDWWTQNRMVTEQMSWLYQYLVDHCEAFNAKSKQRDKLLTHMVEKAITEGLSEKQAYRKAKNTMVDLFFTKLVSRNKHLKEEL